MATTANEQPRQRPWQGELRGILRFRVQLSFRRATQAGMDGKETGKAYDSAIAAWQHDGFEGKPPLKLVLGAFLDGVVDEEILFRR